MKSLTKSICSKLVSQDVHAQFSLPVGNVLRDVRSAFFGLCINAGKAVLRAMMETEWVPEMMATVGLDRTSLPVIWDADFLYGPRTASGEDTYVLCEINVSSCFAIPDEAPAAIARMVRDRMIGGGDGA